MLGHRLRRWPNIGPTLGRCLVFTGKGQSFDWNILCVMLLNVGLLQDRPVISLNLCYLGLYHRKSILYFSTLYLKEICTR